MNHEWFSRGGKLLLALLAHLAQAAGAAGDGSAGGVLTAHLFSDCVVAGPVSNLVAVFPNPATMAWPAKQLGPVIRAIWVA